MERWREEKRGPRGTVGWSRSHTPLLWLCGCLALPASPVLPSLTAHPSALRSSRPSCFLHQECPFSPSLQTPRSSSWLFLDLPKQTGPHAGPLPARCSPLPSPLCASPLHCCQLPTSHFPHQTGSFQAGPRLCFSAPLQALAWQSTSNLKRGSKGMPGWLS